MYLVLGTPSDSVCIFVHGKFGSKEEAEKYPELLEHGQILAIDLPNKGDIPPWEAVPVLEAALEYARARWKNIRLFAVSIGAWFSMQAFAGEAFERCFFVSPVVDFQRLIEDMILGAEITQEQLEREKNIGEFSWDFYAWVCTHPVTKWQIPTSILYAGGDALVRRESVLDFAEKFGCQLTVYEEGEHWFHTDEQMKVLHAWLKDVQL
jgi:hypothetical protein